MNSNLILAEHNKALQVFTISETAAEVLDTEYRVNIKEYRGEVLLEAKIGPGRDLLSFTELGKFMIEEEVKFTYEAESYLLELHDFQKLCKILEQVV